MDKITEIEADFIKQSMEALENAKEQLKAAENQLKAYQVVYEFNVMQVAKRYEVDFENGDSIDIDTLEITRNKK